MSQLPSRPIAYMGDNVALTRTLLGHKMYVDTRDISLAPCILLDGTWEPWITDLLLQKIEPGMTFVDVGANIGWFTILAADRVGPTGRVYAFEPNPDASRLIVRSLQVNGLFRHCVVEQKAVLDRPGEITLYRCEAHHGSSRLNATDAFRAGTRDYWHDDVNEVLVQGVTLDDYLPEDVRVDILKIDVEGSESAVIAGARGLIERNPGMRILMEYTGQNRAAMEELHANGYDMALVSHTSELIAVEPDNLDAHAGLDMLWFEPRLNAEEAAAPHIVLAFGEELLRRPEMVTAFAQIWSGDPGVTLVVYAPGGDPDQVDGEIARLVAAACGDPGALGVVTVTGPLDAQSELELVSGAGALFSRERPHGILADRVWYSDLRRAEMERAAHRRTALLSVR